MAFIHFRPDATTGFDLESDTYKLFGAADAPQLYSITSTDNLSINSLPDITSQPVVSMGFTPGKNGDYNLTATDLETFPTGSTILLEDVVANKVQELTTNPVYSFSAVTTDPIHRFNVHFATVGISDKTTSDISIYSSGNTVYVNIPEDLKGTILVYNMLGNEIARTPIQGHSMNKISLNVVPGIYVVKVDGDALTSTGKVFIR
jgi:hypothetical protein